MLSGCSSLWPSGWLGGSGNALRSSSIETDDTLEPVFPTAVYRYTDENTAEVFLTDLPLDRLADESDPLNDVTGSIVQVQIFLIPWAGRTPIATTALNASVRHAVISQGIAGLYSGGGFVMSDEPGDDALSGRIRQATLRLAFATPDFADRLGPTRAVGSFSATLDEETAAVLAQRLSRLTINLAPVGTASPTQPGAPKR